LLAERNPLSGSTSGDAAPALALELAQALFDPDLQRLVTAWPTLPAHFKAAVLALLLTAPLIHAPVGSVTFGGERRSRPVRSRE
jgi:hypothetical protein